MVAAGQPERAEQLAHTIPDPDRQAQVLTELAVVLAKHASTAASICSCRVTYNDGAQCPEGPLVAGDGLGDERGQTGLGRAAVRLPRALPAGSQPASQPALEADDHMSLVDHHRCSRSSR